MPCWITWSKDTLTHFLTDLQGSVTARCSCYCVWLYDCVYDCMTLCMTVCMAVWLFWPGDGLIFPFLLLYKIALMGERDKDTKCWWLLYHGLVVPFAFQQALILITWWCNFPCYFELCWLLYICTKNWSLPQTNKLHNCSELERCEGSNFVILAGCLPTIKEWHGIKVRASDWKK